MALFDVLHDDIRTAQQALELCQNIRALGHQLRNVLHRQTLQCIAVFHVVGASAFGDVDVFVAQQIRGADSGLGIGRNFVQVIVLDQHRDLDDAAFGPFSGKLDLIDGADGNAVQADRGANGHARRVVQVGTQDGCAPEQPSVAGQQEAQHAQDDHGNQRHDSHFQL